MANIIQFIDILENKIFTLGEDGITFLELPALHILQIHRGSDIEDHGVLSGVYKDSDGKFFHIKPTENPN